MNKLRTDGFLQVELTLQEKMEEILKDIFQKVEQNYKLRDECDEKQRLGLSDYTEGPNSLKNSKTIFTDQEKFDEYIASIKSYKFRL